MNIKLIIFTAAIFLAVPEIARADVIKLLNGSEIDGVIVEKNDKTVVIEMMGGDGGGFRKRKITIDRSLLETVEKPAAPPSNVVDALIQGWDDPTGRGRRTIISILLIPFFIPALGLLILSLFLKHGVKEFWKAALTAFVSWGAAAGLVFLLFDTGKNPAITAATAAILILPFVSGLVLYRERSHKALLFSAVEAAALVLSYFALKIAVPTT